MNREMKFRAWDCENEIMKNTTYYWSESETIKMFWLHNNEWDIMQYTWLKDNNWKEIYEGDVIRVANLYDYINFGRNITYDTEIVSFIERWVYPFVEAGDLDCDYIYDLYDTEIVWNIYENPYLLTK